MSDSERPIDFPPDLFGGTTKADPENGDSAVIASADRPIDPAEKDPKRRRSAFFVVIPVLIVVLIGGIVLASKLTPKKGDIRHIVSESDHPYVPIPRRISESQYAGVDYIPAAQRPPDLVRPPMLGVDRDQAFSCTGQEIVCSGMSTIDPADTLTKIVAAIPQNKPQAKGQWYWVKVTVDKIGV